ncbi:VOC family protein [Salinibacterium soli]|uniref:VOC family protein n=1 Tax=Antiquaquibacter soli TaxID=3064523 RepID=A0ABT9BR12_9MICO|nr:VOC family protein [Protaetiibacter sp. WY-16]MDO7883474.1 VOC family protein [Protaetiibacter sp. WY-16]
MSILNPYLNFVDNAREAIEFYHAVFGGDLAVSTFADFGAPVEPAEAHLVMHAQLDTPAGYTIMASDTPSHIAMPEGAKAFSVSLSGENSEKAELSGYFEKLAEGGTVDQPLGSSPWGATFGMLTDRFGVSWLVNIAGPQA